MKQCVARCELTVVICAYLAMGFFDNLEIKEGDMAAIKAEREM